MSPFCPLLVTKNCFLIAKEPIAPTLFIRALRVFLIVSLAQPFR